MEYKVERRSTLPTAFLVSALVLLFALVVLGGLVVAGLDYQELAK
jgi:hypothetical protein